MMKLKNKGILIIIFLCITSSCVVGGTEEKVFEMSTNPFMFHGKELAFRSENYTPDSFEKKYGKPSYMESSLSGVWSLYYEDEGITVFFTKENKLEGLRFDMNSFDTLNLYGLTINKDDTYKSLRQKLEDKKLSFCVWEYPGSKWRFTVTLFDVVAVDTAYYIDIDCSITGRRVIQSVHFRESKSY